MNRRTKIILFVNEEAQDFYARSLELGELAAKTFSQEGEKGRERHRAQMTGLENIAETTLKWTDVLDYIKKQMARPRGWTKVYDGKSFGESLKNYIEEELPEHVTRVCNRVPIGNEGDDDRRDRQLVYLHLIRQFIRQVVVQYEYKASEPERVAR
jgi:hypothetical protein